VPRQLIDTLEHFGFSSICNVLAAIKTAKVLGLGPDDAIVTVATDGARCTRASTGQAPPATSAAGSPTSTLHRCGASTSANVPTADTLELTERERNRIFNLGYYTWVEQQGTPFELFEARRHQSFWQGLRRLLPVWDDMITEFNARVAAG
jgi:cysteine synthase A